MVTRDLDEVSCPHRDLRETASELGLVPLEMIQLDLLLMKMGRWQPGRAGDRPCPGDTMATLGSELRALDH